MEERGAEVGHSSINRRAFGNTSIAQSTMQFFDKAMRANGIPEKVAMDKSGAKKSATDQILEGKDIEVDARQIKYISNIVEQDRRAIKRNTRPMLGFKKFRATENVPAGIEFMPMVRK